MMKWTTKEGKQIRISDMQDSHLFNSIKVIAQGRSDAGKTVFLYLLAEALDRKLIKHTERLNFINEYEKYDRLDILDIEMCGID